MAAPSSFPLLVEGSWGPDPPKNLSTKLQLYFQSPKRSGGGGECEVRRDPENPARFLLLFSQDVRQKVLQKTNHELVLPGKGTFQLTVQLPTAPDEAPVSKEKILANESKTGENVNEPVVSEEPDTELSLNTRSEKMEDLTKESENVSSLVAFENLKANVTDMMLTLLVENVSGLTSDDFQVEVIQDFRVAVVAFKKHTDTVKFVYDCARHNLIKKFNLSPRLLEETKTIRVENLPPGVDDYQLQLFFENPYHGGGKVARVECFPEESSALVEFCDRKVLDTVMTKKHNFNKMPLSVFPYYTSLGTALYGKEQPLIKLPAPFQESLDLPLWKFFQKKDHLIKELDDEMRRHHCELTWSQQDSKVTIRPAATLVSQGRLKVKTWKKDASAALADIRSAYAVSSFKVAPAVWDTVKNDLEDDTVLIEFDTSKETLTLAGKSDDIRSVSPQIKELLERTTQKIQREEQSLKEKVAVSSEKHFLLHHSGVLQCVCVECPEMEIGYDADTQQLCLKGTQADVYKAKCEVQEKVYTMTEKAIEVSPEVFQFLQQVDHKEFSKSFFIAQKNLTVYELKDTTVLLTSCSSEALVEAEKQMLSALNYKRIEVEDKKVLTGSKWKSFIGNIQKKSDSSSCIMVTNDLTVGSPAGIVVAGLVKEVNEIYSLIFDFLEKNMKIERLIEIKPSLVIDYLRAEKKQFWSKIKKGDVQVVFNPEHKQKGILLIGPKCHVVEGMNFVKEAEKSVFVKSVLIDKPGARQFFQDKAWFYRGEVRKLYGCFIELLENEEKVGGKTDGQKYLIQTEVAPGIFLMVQQGDLTQFPVSAVVNAANEDLKHIAGLAAALSRAAGPELQADCDKIVKRDSRLLPGNAVLSKAGRLPCQHVIHAVGPRWDGHEAPRCVYLLKKAVENSLLLAEKHKCRSIAIPAISSGVFGFPLQQCVESIVLSIKENFQHKQDGWTLKEIYLVDSLEKTAEAFAKVVKTIFKCPVLGRSSPPGTVSQPDTTSLHSGPAANPVAASQEIAFLTAPGGLKILLVKKCLQDATTHVVVNSIPSDLGLYRGPLSQALLEKAGPEIQKELYTAGQGVTASVGTILQTSGCNLQCRRVLHVVTPSWTNNTSAREIMEDIIRDCLEITERLSLQSIAFPAIGTGNLGFPKTILAELLLSTVLEFSSKKPLKTLQEVHLLMHPSDRENIQAFSVEFAKRINGKFSDKVPKAEDKQELYGTVSSPNLGMHEIKIGPIIFQVASGDITKEAADVIVNSTSNRFNLKAGVSKAILENAGQEVEQECALLGQQGKNEYIITKGGSLMCKNIIHVVGGNDVKRSVSCVLQETEKRSYSSICLPAIGTGSAGQDQNKVAEAMLDAIEDFIQKESVQYVKKVKVVIFQSKVLDVFYASMKKREGLQASHQPSLISKFASFFGFSKPPHPKKKALVLEKKTELVVFQLCGENRNCVDQAVRWLEALIAKEQYSYTNTDECIKDFDEKEYQELNELQKKLNITISLDQKRPFIEVLGITRDVMEARDKIEEMMKKVRSAKEEENRADCISEFIEWRYGEDNTFHRFDKITNLQLEDARKAKNKSTVVKINNQSYTVNLKDSTASSPDGHSVIIQRFTKSEVDLPGYWSDMKQQNLCVVQLQPGDVEFNTVAGKFNQTCSQFVIEKIERIQNPDLWNSYQAKKKTMDSKNGQGTNEKLLFHGTDVDSVPYVNRNGFNRSYAGKNAVAYGKGTYFAVNANYSANDIYSKPDANGKKHMYYVRVLTGMYTNGHSSLIVPPSKVPQNPTDLYDTVTDNKHNPSLFVVFYDYQAYPEYLITFRR